MSRPYHNPELIIKLYTIDNLSSKDIAKQIGISDVSVLNWLKRYNIPIKKTGSFNYKIRKTTTEIDLKICELYTQWMSSRKIKEVIGNIDKTTIIEIIKRYNITPHSKGYNAKQWSKSHMWKGWISKISTLIRHRKETKQWKKKVLKRNGYKCVQCWATTELEVDHIIPLKEIRRTHNIKDVTDELFIKIPLLTDINNGRTLCFNCHKQTETYWNIY